MERRSLYCEENFIKGDFAPQKLFLVEGLHSKRNYRNNQCSVLGTDDVSLDCGDCAAEWAKYKLFSKLLMTESE